MVLNKSGLEGNINPSKINTNYYIGLTVSELVALIPHDYKIRILKDTERKNERIVTTNSITLNVVIDKNNVITKVLGYYN